MANGWRADDARAGLHPEARVALVVGIEQAVASLVATILAEEGYRTAVAAQVEERSWPMPAPDLVVAPFLADSEAARSLCSRIKARVPTPVLLLLADSQVFARASEGLSWGADAVVPNPFVLSAFRDALQRGRQRNASPDTGALGRVEGMVGSHPQLREYFRALQALATSDLPVALFGEHGTGKLLWAQALHHMSLRARGPLMVASCTNGNGSDPAALLFGLSGDPIAGAVERVGAALQADLGTLVVRRVHQAQDDLLARLERLVTEGCVHAVGAGGGTRVDVRVIATATRDLRTLRDFPPRLAARLGCVALHLPPLRERVEDIASLADHFLALHARALHRPVPHLTPPVLARLERYDWPGNLRELETCMRRSLLLSENGEVSDELVHALIERRLAVPPEQDTLAYSAGIAEP